MTKVRSPSEKAFATFLQTELMHLQLITSVDLKVQLHTRAHTVIRQCQDILERPLALTLQHDLMRLTTNVCCNDCLKSLDTV
jgi:hypothetical protein